METFIKNLADSLAVMNVQRTKLSAELLVSGLVMDEGLDVKRLALAGFQSLLRAVVSEDIVSVRQFQVRPLGEGAPSSAAASAPAVIAETSAIRPFSLLVTMTTAGIARRLEVAKARRRKLHSSEQDGVSLREAGVVTPLRTALIDIDEFLPADIHNFRRSVRTAAKEKGYNSFARGGEVFIRRKEDRATRVTSLTD